MNSIPKSLGINWRASSRRRSFVLYSSQAFLGGIVALASCMLVQQSPPESMLKPRGIAARDIARRGSQGHRGSFVEQGGFVAESDAATPILRMRSETPDSPEAERVRERVSKLMGDWEDDYQGKRYLTLREDGTATMVVLPNGIGKRIFAARLEFDINWTFLDEILTLDMHGGRPENKVRLIQRMFGRVGEFRVQSVSDDEMLISDLKDDTKYVWRRSASAGVVESAGSTETTMNESNADTAPENGGVNGQTEQDQSNRVDAAAP